MKSRNIHCRTIIPAIVMALTLSCVSWQTTQAGKGGGGGGGSQGGSIVGLWDVHYYVGATEIFETYDQWHSDGNEFEVNNLGPGAICQGTWMQIASNMVKLYHVGFTFGGAPCPANNVRFEETQTNTVSLDGNSYSGEFDTIYYDKDGNCCEVKGTLNATRLSADTTLVPCPD